MRPASNAARASATDCEHVRWTVDVAVRAGDFVLQAAIAGGADPVALIGPNGSGKTTLIRAVAGAVEPVSGRVEVAGRVLFDSAEGRSLPPEQRRVGFVPQGYGLFPHLTAASNVAFGLLTGPNRIRSRRERRRRAAAMLDEIECGHLADRYPATLSGGEKQRVALARALLPDPEMLLLDEPLAAMDVTMRRGLRRFLAGRLAERGRPAIVVTHDVRDVRALGTPLVVALEGGRVVQRGSPDEMAERPANDFVAEFFGAE